MPLDPRALPPVEPRPTPATPKARASVALTVAALSGALTRAEVDGVLAKQRVHLMRVFEYSAAGELTYVLETEPQGAVVKAQLEGPVGAESARGLQAIRRWKFPAHELPSTVRLLVQVSLPDGGSR